MKKVIKVLLFLVCIKSVYAQNTTLTKGETISYLEKKIKEVEGTIVGQYSYSNFSLRYEDGKIITSYVDTYNSGKTKSSTSYEFRFNPLYITGFSFFSLNSPDFRGLRIKLSVPPQYIQNGNRYQREEADFFFVGNRNDDSNAQKIIKAFKHLQALLKAEDDPFQ